MAQLRQIDPTRRIDCRTFVGELVSVIGIEILLGNV
jgi:hypothetical protein